MKILYIGDNRNRGNWGCRATSIALAQLLSQRGEIADIIDGSETGFTNTPIPWQGMRPARLWRKIDSLPTAFLRRLVASAKSNFGIIDDFVDECPERSVDRFIKLQGRFPVLDEIMRKVVEADVLVINGEGSYIFTTPARRDSLFFNFILRLGQRFRKKTYLLNAMFSECPKSGFNGNVFTKTLQVLSDCDAVSARDPHSYSLIRDAGLVENVSYHPDALFTWSSETPSWQRSVVGGLSRFELFRNENHLALPDINFDQPYICISGSSSAAWNQQRAYEAYKKLAIDLSQLNCQLLITPTCTGDAFLNRVAKDLKLPLLALETPIRICAAIVSKAEVFVSGRFHPAILASNGGTPCVFMGSNSHKTLSLQKMLDYQHPLEYGATPDRAEIGQIVTTSRRLLEHSVRASISYTIAKRAAEASRVIDLIKTN